MGTIISQKAVEVTASVGPRLAGAITVADILTANGDHAAGSSDRYFHHQWAAIMITRGGYRVGADPGMTFDAQAGDFLIMVAKTDHAWTTADHPIGRREGVAATFALFRPSSRIEELLRYPEVQPHYRLVRIGDRMIWRRMLRCFRQMQAVGDSHLPHRAELQLSLLEQALLWCAVGHKREGDTTDARVRRVIEYMTSYLADPLTIRELCKVAQVSRSQFAVIFERATGQSPMRYLEALRLERAMQRLRMTTQKIEDIADVTGFCDAKYFAKRFRAVVGMTPGAYRRMQQDEHS